MKICSHRPVFDVCAHLIFNVTYSKGCWCNKSNNMVVTS